MIPVNQIRQYYFCHRIPYYSLCTNLKPIYPKHVELGLDYHKSQEMLLKSRKFKKLKIEYISILSNYYIEDESLNLNGILDIAFICKDEVIPVEFKNINKKPNLSHILQLTAYGILLEKETKKNCYRGFIIYSNNIKFYPIKITQFLKEKVMRTIKNIEVIIRNGHIPYSSAEQNKCLQCEYLNFCNDRF